MLRGFAADLVETDFVVINVTHHKSPLTLNTSLSCVMCCSSIMTVKIKNCDDFYFTIISCFFGVSFLRSLGYMQEYQLAL
ncbi:hypothetical protein LF95_19220 [Thalassospira sp. TSL5-1]|nr:hypothetical protein LF95_19220 [Thalassospira sp. TSL5-1]